METCDMHIHTINSDGELTTKELLEYADICNLKKLSITDHDRVDAYDDLKILNTKGFDIITGCEFVCVVDNVPIEILGYGINIDMAKKYLDKNGITQNKLDYFRMKFVPQIFKKYNITLNLDENRYDKNIKNPKMLQYLLEIINHNEKAKILIKQENPALLENTNNFLRLGLNNPNSFLFMNMSFFYPSYKQIAEKINEFGGLSFLAHPYQYAEKMNFVLDKVKSCVNGIECYHFTADDESKKKYLFDFCNKYKLLKSGGSDFHCKNHKTHKKDKLNQLNVPTDIFQNIKKQLEINNTKYLYAC